MRGLVHCVLLGAGIGLWVFGFFVVLAEQGLLGSTLIVLGGILVGFGAMGLMKGLKP